MAEVIELRELQAARDRARRRHADHAHLERAVAVMRDNLAAVAEQTQSAPDVAQPELLARVENLVAMIRYGMRMLTIGKPADAAGQPDS